MIKIDSSDQLEQALKDRAFRQRRTPECEAEVILELVLGLRGSDTPTLRLVEPARQGFEDKSEAGA